MSFSPTPEQSAVVANVCHSKDSLIVEALAGAAKTTTIEMALQELRPRFGQVLAVAFNKKIADNLAQKLPSEVTVKTMNGLGHGAWGGFLKKKLYLEQSKTYFLTKDIFEEYNVSSEVDEDDYLPLMAEVQGLVNGAKAMGLVPKQCVNRTLASPLADDTMEDWESIADALDLDISDLSVKLARAVLILSIAQAFEGKIDFGDQIYMPVCWRASFNQFPIVVVDEAQDLSALNHIMLKRSVARGGKLIAIGDRHQAIYAFRGAAHDSMDQLQSMFGGEVLELNTTFRCGSKIADHVRDWVPRIASPAWAQPGEVNYLGTIWDKNTFPIGSAVICRNNAPLVKLAFQLLKQGRKVTFNGGELHTQLVKLVERVCGVKAKASERDKQGKLTAITVADLKQRVKAWEAKEVEQLRKTGKERRVHGVRDRAECLQYLADGTETVERDANAYDVCSYINRLFSDSHGSVVLTSGHKSKGLEWDHVFHLDSHLIPSKYAQGQKDAGNDAPWTQEMNLRYVISTRAKKSLNYVSTEDQTLKAGTESARQDLG